METTTQFDIIDEVKDQWDFITTTEEQKKQEKLERRQKRIEDCGSWAYWFDPHTGRRQSYMFYCEVFRECDLCLERRTEEEKLKITDALFHNKRMNWKIVEDGEMRNLVRQSGMNKEDYTSYPLDDGTRLVISKAKFGVGEKLTYGWAMSQDWKSIVNTPEGRNRSGRLLAEIPQPDEEETTTIETEQFITTADGKVVMEIMDQVAEETCEMKPETVEDVERSLTIRTSETIKRLRSLGYSVTIYYRNFKLVHSKICWDNNSINTENLPQHQLELTFANDSVPK